jgi:PAS domain S-box-containing protein/putative nucleotidyltransferase with HDIG domain
MMAMRDAQNAVENFIRELPMRGREGSTLDMMQEKLRDADIIFNSVPAMIFYKDTGNCYIRVNNAFSELVGMPREEIEGRNARDILPGHAELYWEHDRDVIETGSAKRNIIEPIETDSGLKWIRADKIPCRDGNGRLTGIIGFAVDITELKSLQDELERNHAKLKEMNDILKQEIDLRKSLHRQLQRNIDEMQQTMEGIISVIAITVEKRDPYTAGHQRRVAELACAIANEMNLTDEHKDGIRMAGNIHDIGKISIPAEILSKPGQISEIELNIIKEHSKTGYDIVRNIDFPWPIAEIIYQHHEYLNGTGYPRGLRGDEILLETRILTVADVVDAMSSHRPYRAALGISFALDEIRRDRGILYDPDVVDACDTVVRRNNPQLNWEGAGWR